MKFLPVPPMYLNSQLWHGIFTRLHRYFSFPLCLRDGLTLFSVFNAVAYILICRVYLFIYFNFHFIVYLSIYFFMIPATLRYKPLTNEMTTQSLD